MSPGIPKWRCWRRSVPYHALWWIWGILGGGVHGCMGLNGGHRATPRVSWAAWMHSGMRQWAVAGPCAPPAPRGGGDLCVGKAPPGPWPGTGCGAPASSPQPCITAGRLQRVAIDREMARRGAAATPATRRAVRLARCAVPRSAKLHYGSPVGARLWVRDFRGFFAGVGARDQGMWPIGPDSRDYEETTFCWK